MSIGNNMMFSTKDRDQDIHKEINCAEKFKAGWWYRSCKDALLTAPYGRYPLVQNNSGITWKKPWGDNKFPKFARMMIRPNQATV